MNGITTFDSTKESLLDLLRSIGEGKTQLPDFQRGWVWDDEHIRGILASVSLAYPIGAVMMLQTGNPDVRFKPRLVEGVTIVSPPEPERFILDGQQRLTSLLQALYSGHPVTTKDVRGKTIRRWFYVDINKALDPSADREDAIIALPEDRKIRNFRGEVTADYSNQGLECAGELLPLPLVFDNVNLTNWQMLYLQSDPTRIAERLSRWNQLLQNVIQRFQQYQLPLILLRKETPKEAVCQVFEKVNTGGVSLTVFELLTATYAADDYNLRDDWIEREKRLRLSRLLKSFENTDFLQAVTLLATRARKNASADAAVSCKRKDILRLTLDDYRTWAEPATKGFEAAAKFLHTQKIYTHQDLPYRTQLVPLAAIFAALGEKAEQDSVRMKLSQWYWCGVFGELYGSAVETRFAKDLPEVIAWVAGGPEPATVQDANFAPSRLYTLRTRNSAAYKGVNTILLRGGSLDFRTGAPIDDMVYFDDKIDIHHIFPQAWCKRQGIDPGRCDSIVNKTPLDAKTNRIISGHAPSSYLERVRKNAGIDDGRMDEILRSHVIDPKSLRSDNFDRFFQIREKSLLERIEKAMGKKILGATAMVDTEDVGEYQESDEIAA